MTVVIALSILIVMTVPMLALLSTSAFERLIARNLVDARQALFVAEAGVEWAFNRLVQTDDWSAALAGPPGTPSALAPPSGLLSPGTASISIVGSPGDGDAVVVTSTATVNRARRTIEAVVRRSRVASDPGASPAGVFGLHGITDWRER